MKKVIIALIIVSLTNGCFYLNPMGSIEKKMSETESRINQEFKTTLETELTDKWNEINGLKNF
jgi:uncharacterized protein YceK